MSIVDNVQDATAPISDTPVTDGIADWDTVMVREQCRRFERMVSTLGKEVRDVSDKLTRFNMKHLSDIEKIGVALIGVADEKNWCNEYDEFIENLNSDLYYQLPTRECDYEVDIDIYEERTQRITITVTASSEDEAYERAEEEIINNPEGHINDYNWETDEFRTSVEHVKRA